MTKNTPQEKVPNNYQLSVQMHEMDYKLNTLLKGQASMKEHITQCKSTSKERLDKLEVKLGKVHRYYKAVTIVAGSIGAGMVVAFDWARTFLRS